MKDRFRNIGVILFASSLIIFIFLWLIYTILLLESDPQLAGAYTATGTLLLALVTGLLAFLTYFSVKNGYDKERRDRKERLLNEVIEWALGATKTAIFRQTIKPHELWETRLKYKCSISHGKYIKRIVVAHFARLESSFNEVLNRLDIALRYTQKFAEKSAIKQDLLECEQQVAESVEKLTEEAAKIKTETLT